MELSAVSLPTSGSSIFPAGPWGSFIMGRKRGWDGGGRGVRFSLYPHHNYPTGLSRDNTTCVALGGESPGGLLRYCCVFRGRRGGVLSIRLPPRRSQGPIKGGLRTRDDINSLRINIIPEGEKDKSIVRFALECAARFFFFSLLLLLFLLLLPVILNVLSRRDKANRWE